MAGEWRSVQLGDVTELITGFPFQSERYTDDPVAPRLLRGDNVVQGSLRWDGVKRWPRDATAELDNYWLRDGDIVLAMDRPWIEAGLKYAAIRSSDLPALLGAPRRAWSGAPSGDASGQGRAARNRPSRR